MSRDEREDTRTPGETSTEKLPGDPGDPPVRPSLEISFSLLLHHAGETSVERLVPGRPLVVGRDAVADRCLPYRSLSRRHAEFLLQDGKISVRDLGSTNGTWIARKRLGMDRVDVPLGEEITLGSDVLVRIQSVGVPRESAFEPEEMFRRRLQDEVTRAKHFRHVFALFAVRVSARIAEDIPAERWAAKLRGKLREVDHMRLYTPSAALVLLPQIEAEAALKIAQIIAAPENGGDGGIAFQIGLAVYPAAAITAEALISLADEACSRTSTTERVQEAPTAPWTASLSTATGDDLVAGTSLRRLLRDLAPVANSNLTVVLHGETGTGKELLAGYIHQHSPRSERNMVRVNCGGIAESILESELFGHQKGSFTGAAQQRAGMFEEADGSTLFLDEVAELSMAAQAALLRVLESRKLTRVGTHREVEVDVRIIAATHRNLQEMVEEGSFRKDLFYRLEGMVLEIPPLRERLDEMGDLVSLFIRKANKLHKRQVRRMSEEAMALLCAYHWPGNHRELRNAVHLAVVLAQHGEILPEHLPATLRHNLRDDLKPPPSSGQRTPPATSAPAPPPLPQGTLTDEVEAFTAQRIRSALEKTGWNQTKAAELLGIPRRTFSRWVTEYGIKKPVKP
ncbi:sigma-54-dependent Fis family transcriptional regulator [Chondromyces apiculatus]|uniref:Response regulator containing CheY-like receiver, AAA-type ATPase, and DNA-binding domains n=1 Tax=Chondromyces apiculatus DSM 436 TaxID=1192034 RepID=A0A017SSZ8_9BACT|nr:sigma-54-dependent Fis family transcriptional regulator [Chondromyces apiculatus]EYF00108.1 response regulator containing CheY-like receiver, AAA-type ATPase, and DNA-binding domains [Chondromyces apiculatus DSM 436]